MQHIVVKSNYTKGTGHKKGSLLFLIPQVPTSTPVTCIDGWACHTAGGMFTRYGFEKRTRNESKSFILVLPLEDEREKDLDKVGKNFVGVTGVPGSMANHVLELSSYRPCQNIFKMTPDELEAFLTVKVMYTSYRLSQNYRAYFDTGEVRQTYPLDNEAIATLHQLQDRSYRKDFSERLHLRP